MKVISLVPSWTETFIDCGIDVIGRTRFCIHPSDQVKPIPVVGGTKDWNLDLVLQLKPDLVVFDREENSKEMVDECPFPWVSTHVLSLESLKEELKKLSDVTKNKNLLKWSEETEKLLQTDFKPEDLLNSSWILEKSWESLNFSKNDYANYVIWAQPWMLVSEKTYIGSILKHFGFKNHYQSSDERYPKLENLQDAEEELYFFSSEPFPFHKKKDLLKPFSFPWAVVDGEFLSWYGVRSLKKLQQIRLLKSSARP